MTDLIQAASVVPSVVALAAGGAAWRWWDLYRGERREGERLRGQVEELTRYGRATEEVLGQLARGVIPGLGAEAGQPGTGRGVDIALPQVLVDTVLAQRLAEVANSAAQTVRTVQYDAQSSTRAQIAEAHQSAQGEAERARESAQEASRAAVRAVSSAMVGMASKLSGRVSQGVRRHEGDEAYATLVGIDHPTQQMLLVAQNYVVLSGGKLSRRWPATPLTDVVRAAMGSIEEYERVEHQELQVWVTSRAVGPVVHALAALLDNAVRYSPSSARVYVAFQEGHHGVSVIVDDAGLRMNDEQLTWARAILTGARREGVNELGAHPQTGLRAAAALAADYGFRIDVEAPNPFGGTRVYLFLPKSLLTAPPAPSPVPAPVPASGTRSVPAPQSDSGAAAASGAGEGPVPERRTTASGLTVRSRKTPRTGRPTPAAPSAASAPSGPLEPAAPAESVEPTGSPAAGSADSSASPTSSQPFEPSDSAGAGGGQAAPGRPAVAAAWATGTRRARTQDPTTTTTSHEGAPQ
ncbi:ATP-binding protein [Streptomyces sp. NPDC041068]|uniref:ATP-binding protein n=1 Tax=Streptomyces sp. NPDC041068 TaxID=3155130 RepID=UPI0033F657A4